MVISKEEGPRPQISEEVYEFFCSEETGGYHISRTNWQAVMLLFTICRVAYPFLVVLTDSQLAKKIGSIIRLVPFVTLIKRRGRAEGTTRRAIASAALKIRSHESHFSSFF